MGIALRRGRVFTDRDGFPGQAAAIINERFASKYWPGEDAIGKRLRVSIDPGPGEQPVEQPWLTVVGVAPDIRQRPPSEPEIQPLVYIPYRQAPPQRYIIVLARS